MKNQSPFIASVYKAPERPMEISGTALPRWTPPAALGRPNYPFNGYIARCGGFAHVLAVVGEYRFPDVHGNLLDFPEGNQPRRD